MYKHPGVYIEHVPSGLLAVEAAATSIAAFVGPARRGPVGEPVFILNAGQYEEQFGPLGGGFGGIRDFGASPDRFGHAVNAFFANGGAKAYIVRVAEDGTGSANLRSGLIRGERFVELLGARNLLVRHVRQHVAGFEARLVGGRVLEDSEQADAVGGGCRHDTEKRWVHLGMLSARVGKWHEHLCGCDERDECPSRAFHLHASPMRDLCRRRIDSNLWTRASIPAARGSRGASAFRLGLVALRQVPRSQNPRGKRPRHWL